MGWWRVCASQSPLHCPELPHGRCRPSCVFPRLHVEGGGPGSAGFEERGGSEGRAGLRGAWEVGCRPSGRCPWLGPSPQQAALCGGDVAVCPCGCAGVQTDIPSAPRVRRPSPLPGCLRLRCGVSAAPGQVPEEARLSPDLPPPSGSLIPRPPCLPSGFHTLLGLRGTASRGCGVWGPGTLAEWWAWHGEGAACWDSPGWGPEGRARELRSSGDLPRGDRVGT